MCDAAYLHRPGPKLVEGVEMLGRILHPQRVHKQAPEGKCCKLSLTGGRRCRPRQLPGFFLPYL